MTKKAGKKEKTRGLDARFKKPSPKKARKQTKEKASKKTNLQSPNDGMGSRAPNAGKDNTASLR